MRNYRSCWRAISAAYGQSASTAQEIQVELLGRLPIKQRFAVWPVWRTLRLAGKQTKVRHAIYAKYLPLINAAKAAGDLEREQELQAAQTRELEAKDKTGTAIGGGGGISFNWQSVLAEGELKKLTYSLVWVSAGLVSGTAASVWSFLGSF